LETSSVEVDGLSGDEREIANGNASADGRYPDIVAAGVGVSRKASTELDGEEAAHIRVYGTQAISETLTESGTEIWNVTGNASATGCVSAKPSVAAYHVRYEEVDVGGTGTWSGEWEDLIFQL
jgi:hypothetical protein